MIPPDPLAERLRADALQRRRPPAPGFTRRVMDAIDAQGEARRTRRPARLRLLAVAAAALLVAAAAWRLARPEAASAVEGGDAQRLVRMVLPEAFADLARAAFPNPVEDSLRRELDALFADAGQVAGALAEGLPRPIAKYALEQ